MNTLFPLFVNLQEKSCVVVGGGMVARRKVTGLLECQAAVRVISPVSVPQIFQLHQEKKIELIERTYQPQDLKGAFLVVAATNDRHVNVSIAQECAALNTLCNVVNDPDAGNYYAASTYTCGDLKIAISTNGVSPALARTIKAEFAERYPHTLIPYLDYLKRMRDAIKTRIPDEASRTMMLQKLVADPDIREKCLDEHFQSQIAHLNYEQEVEKWL